ncbi:hypothetical protein [Alienimonas californiensis]|uniref:DUF4303 domain-containing protein n=1 Tax=Alienimonas californiensis TaxID=2527989 RepID=A0A517PEM2_9PLAN|nr:hypothetical protein [Alienimonas californiensis]QDT17815.1 hypothetical protein CA12_39490 [Alienimonas californiensis]
MGDDLAAALNDWRAVLKQELEGTADLVRAESDVFAFAIDLPSDLSNPGFMPGVVRGSSGQSVGARLLSGDWEYSPQLSAFDQAQDQLVEICETYHDRLIGGDYSEDTAEGAAFRDAVYEAFLTCMAEVSDAGRFGDVTVKALMFSDDEHPVVEKSLRRLNPPEVAEAALPHLA